MIACYKHSSLGLAVSNDEKKFYNIDTRWSSGDAFTIKDQFENKKMKNQFFKWKNQSIFRISLGYETKETLFNLLSLSN